MHPCECIGQHLISYSLDGNKVICMAQVVSYYERCARTNNHTTREATCACWGELATKIDAASVQPFVPRMLKSLLACLRDDAWNVSHTLSDMHACFPHTVHEHEVCC